MTKNNCHLNPMGNNHHFTSMEITSILPLKIFVDSKISDNTPDPPTDVKRELTVIYALHKAQIPVFSKKSDFFLSGA